MKTITTIFITFFLSGIVYSQQQFKLNPSTSNAVLFTPKIKESNNVMQFDIETCKYSGLKNFPTQNQLSDIKLAMNTNMLKGNSEKLSYTLLSTACATTYTLAALSNSEPEWAVNMKPDLKSRTLISAGLFVPIVTTGFLMRGSEGNPNDAILTVHKLSSVSNLVLLDATVLKKRKSESLTWIEAVTTIGMNLGFVCTIATGGIQSMNKPVPSWVNTTHKITPWFTIIASGTLLYLLNK